MKKIGLGRIVWLKSVIDPQGNDVGRHAAIILSKPGETPIKAVLISTQIQRYKGDPMVLLPYANRKGGHSVTRLTKKSAAMCKWVVKVDESEIEDYKGEGTVYGKLLIQIQECINASQNASTQS